MCHFLLRGYKNCEIVVAKQYKDLTKVGVARTINAFACDFDHKLNNITTGQLLSGVIFPT